MLKERRQACENVKAAFLATESTAEATVRHGLECLETMLNERAKLRLPIETGADALAMVGEGLAHATKAYASLAKAHPHLRTIPAGIGVAEFGTSDSEKNAPAFTGLRAVGQAA